MLDLKIFLEDPNAIHTALKNRGSNMNIDEVLALNGRRKSLQHEFDTLRAQQNQKSKEIAALQKDKKDVAALIAEMQGVATRLKGLAAAQGEVEERQKALLLTFPNIPHASVPVGQTPANNHEVRRIGSPRLFDFKPAEHWQIGEALGMLEFESAARMSGARFSVLRGPLARLERALIHFMLERHTRENGYEEILPPLLVNADALTGTGQLPKFETDLFKTTAGYYLIPTAEVPLTNLYREEILPAKRLPLKFCAYTPCFRSEAGASGKDIKGLIRQHQFNKVELVKIVAPEKSYEELEGLTRDAEGILAALELPYRTVVLCTGDMGFGAAKTYDIEVWLPGQNVYREISSCSNFEAFQARRMQTRFRGLGGKPEYVHTLNGSGLAVGRTLVAILENYQQRDGSITVPQVLRPFMGTTCITPQTPVK